MNNTSYIKKCVNLSLGFAGIVSAVILVAYKIKACEITLDDVIEFHDEHEKLSGLLSTYCEREDVQEMLEKILSDPTGYHEMLEGIKHNHI